MKQKKYEKIVVLDSLTGVLIAPFLIKYYNNRFIYDIRDYSYENNIIYKYLEKFLIKKSYFTSVSSRGFLSFLPENNNYVFTHNTTLEELKLESSYKKRIKEKINFVWLGSVRYLKHQSGIIEKLSRDGRFNIIFHGIGPELDDFKEYVKKNKLPNVCFTGKYSNAEKAFLLARADIINNSYENTYGTKFAISNKFYDGIVYHIPQLVECNCYKEALIKEYPVGIALSPNDDSFAEKLFQYHRNLDENKFNKACDDLRKKVNKEEINCIRRITLFFNDTKVEI